jgi:uncharacterized protein YejL (UPF0352 family)
MEKFIISRENFYKEKLLCKIFNLYYNWDKDKFLGIYDVKGSYEVKRFYFNSAKYITCSLKSDIFENINNESINFLQKLSQDTPDLSIEIINNIITNGIIEDIFLNDNSINEQI